MEELQRPGSRAQANRTLMKPLVPGPLVVHAVCLRALRDGGSSPPLSSALPLAGRRGCMMESGTRGAWSPVQGLSNAQRAMTMLRKEGLKYPLVLPRDGSAKQSGFDAPELGSCARQSMMIPPRTDMERYLRLGQDPPFAPARLLSQRVLEPLLLQSPCPRTLVAAMPRGYYYYGRKHFDALLTPAGFESG